MAIENINDYAGMWANGVNIGQLWDKIKEKFVSGAHVQSDATTYPASWKQQARANLGLTIGANKMWYGSAANTIGEVTTSTFGRGLLNTTSGSEVTGLFAETAEKDKNGIEISENYAHSLAITDGYLRLKNNRYVSGTASAQDLSALQLNVKLGLLQLDNTGSAGKIPLVHIPDSIMGQLTYGGTITAYTQSTDSLTVSITTGAKAILEQKTGRTISGNTIYLVNSSTTSGTNFNYADCKGMYFIWTDNALEDHTGETARYRIWPSGGPRYQAGDWMISNDTEWDKVDNTDAVTGVKGSNQNTFGLGNVSLDALDVRALATYLTNTTQTVADKVQFNKDIWSLGGVAAYGISDLSAGGGGGGGLSGTIIRNWSNYQGAETEVLGANLGMRGFRMSGYSFQVNKPAVGADNWQTEFTLGTENIPDLPLTQITGTTELRKIETLSATGTPSGFLKRASNGNWSFDTNSYALASALNDYLPLTGGTIVGSTSTPLIIQSTSNNNYVSVRLKSKNHYRNFGLNENGDLFITNLDGWANEYKIWHAGNMGAGSGLNADKLDGYEANGLFESLTNDNDQLKIQIGNTSKLLTLDYAKKTSRMRTEIKADQEFVYRQSPQTIDADSFKLDRIKGKTLSWNNFIVPTSVMSNSLSITNISYANGTYTYNINDTSTSTRGTGVGLSPFTFYAGHKYYYGCTFASRPQNLSYFYFGGVSTNVEVNLGTDLVIRGIYDCSTTQTASMAMIGFVLNGACSGTIKQSNYRLIDLTLMFGSGKEPSTAEDFEALYNSNILAPNAGQLINNDAKQFESVGFNIWDEEWEVGSYNSSNGSKTTSASNFRCKNLIPVFPSTIYYFKAPTSILVIAYDKNGNYLEILDDANANGTFTTPANCGFLTFYILGTSYANNICINLSDPAKNGTYEPYERIVTELNLDAIQVKSHNIWDEEWEVGSLNSNGEKTNNTHYIRSRNYVPIEPDAEYYFKSGTNTGNSANLFGAAYFDENKNFISVAFKTLGSSTVTKFTPPQGAFYMWFIFGDNNDVYVWTTYNNDICINESSSFNGQYEPHGILTINGLKQAGSVYDEIVRNKYIRRVGSVDLGDDLGYNKYGNNYRLNVASRAGGTNFVCARYSYVGATGEWSSFDQATTVGTYIKASNETYIGICPNGTYSDSNAFRTAHSGVLLNYELATPIEYELASPIPDTMPAGTTERIISDRLPVTPFACDMTYGANPKDILASAVPFSRLQGVRLERGAFTMSTQNDSNWYLVTLGDKKLYLRFTVNTGAFKLEMASDDTENPEYSKSFEFATLSTADINAICV